MAHLDSNAANAIKAVDPDTIHVRDHDGGSASSEKDAGVVSKTTTPQQPEPARWFHWHEPGTSAEEKKLIFKLDWFLLSFSCLMYFVKQLDQNNIANAYVSGMSEELGFGPGDELSWMNTYFNIGVIIGGSFANLVITVVRPRFWLSGCLFTWSLFVLFLFKCQNAHQFYVLRFFIGLFESAAWPGVMYCIGSWYRKSELARRSGLFVMSGVLGQMFSGYLQSALYSGMEGRGGISAWRWLFIFDFIIAVPVVVYGLICFPDTPHTTKAFYFNEWERRRACERIDEEGRKPVGKLNLSVIRRIFGSWQVYAFTAAYCFWTLTCGSYIIQYFTLYLKSTKMYTVPEINNIPTSVGAVNFVFMVATGFIADKIGRRGPVCFAVGCLLTFDYAVLTVWNVSHSFRLAVFILVGCYGCYTPLLAGWANEACGGDQQKRAFVLGFMVSVGQAVVIPFQQLQMPSSQAPTFKQTHGWASSLAMVAALTLWTGIGLPLLQKWRGSQVKVSNVEESED
ncbi:hypothetical protein JX265_004562 [Neoarthrinium moseri]|uniref:Major facilitator superfamily (MFS) profile domain-containing protein n=1 Tax=Neoarthrinium moseri TaxID=1658444 RepID=A0A9Q0ASJ2_9PEZI|nr:uncharacterized protein JN550_008118 [Neoarthrinium moseri]KAI1851030.1 hypothetical protein JX266_003695 [Neoarthrinium moseri]KAI1865860.1 hypothetical protein JN550_008118 [Neoarthrinium moseri]KAI1875504.1 hypothetical protein JX265_004562 [Neoarthrinium moseri]